MINRYQKQVDKISEHFKDNEGISFDEFCVLMTFFENLDTVKMYLHKYRFIDYSTFLEIVDSFVKQNHFCKKKKTGIAEDVAKALFLVFDMDESGEIEPEEITLFDGKTTSVAKEDKVANDIKDVILKQYKAIEILVLETLGYK